MLKKVFFFSFNNISVIRAITSSVPDLSVGLVCVERGQLLEPSYTQQESGLEVSLPRLHKKNR